MLPDTTTAAEPGPCLVQGLYTNRRAHRRFLARELLGGGSARIKFGPPVSLVDISAGGALIETEARLRPDSEAVLELVGDLRHIIVPFRVVRCQVSALNGSLLYRGACDFTRELDLSNLVLPSAVAEVVDTPIDPPERLDVALKTILEPYLRPADGAAVTPQSLSGRQVTELVKSLQMAILQGGMPVDWQLRPPKASTWLAALPGMTREGGAGGPGGRAERRRHVRVIGPFDGRRHGAIDTPVLIHNLSEGGCFVDSLLQAEAGRPLSLGVSVPGEGWITVKAEVVHDRPGFGFAVRFVDMPDATRACLARMVARRTESVVPDVAREQLTACNAW